MDSIENTAGRYDEWHKKISGFLGSDYDQDRVDAIAGNIGYEQVVKEVEMIAMSSENGERGKKIQDWYDRHEKESLR